MNSPEPRLASDLIKGTLAKVRPPEEQIEGIHRLLMTHGFMQSVDPVEQMRRSRVAAKHLYEGGLGLRDVERLWDHCVTNGRNPAALMTHKVRTALGDWPWR